jgi:hypothetical protein
MITDQNNIRATVADIKNKHLAILKEEQLQEKTKLDQKEVRDGLARCGLVCLVERLKIVFEDSHKLSKLGITITHRHDASDPDGITMFNGNIYGTHHHYIDIRHGNGFGAIGTIRVYSSCEPNMRVFYGAEIFDTSRDSKVLNGIIDGLCRNEDGEKLSLVTNANLIVLSHAHVMGKLLAKAEL